MNINYTHTTLHTHTHTHTQTHTHTDKHHICAHILIEQSNVIFAVYSDRTFNSVIMEKPCQSNN